MTDLGGDSYLNEWTAPMIPFSQLAKCDVQTHEAIFATDNGRVCVYPDGEDDSGQTGDEADLDGQERIPFPAEHHMKLGKEMANMFDADVGIFTQPGSGEMIKAFLLTGKYVVALCKSTAHKNFIKSNLETWVENMNLVSFSDAPTKPPQLIAYEKALKQHPPQPNVPAPAPQGVPAPAPQPVAANVPVGEQKPAPAEAPVGEQATPPVPAVKSGLFAFGTAPL